MTTKNISASIDLSTKSGLDVRVYDALWDADHEPNVYYRFSDQNKARAVITEAQKKYEIEMNKIGGDFPPRLGYLSYAKPRSGYYIDLCTAFTLSSLQRVKEAAEESGLTISHVIVTSKYIQEIQKEWS